MNLSVFGKIAGAVALTSALAGCFDVTMDLEVLSETAGKATMTTTMSADIYTMMKEQSGGSDEFCGEEDSVLTENEDGSATCVQVREGSFDELELNEDEGATVTVVSPGVVRVAFDTAKLGDDVSESTGGEDEEVDEQTKAMINMMFEGHAMTIRVGGKKVVDTNMALSADGTSAETVIPLLDLMNGTTELPPELYAVVDTN